MRKAQHKGKRVLASALCVGMLASMVPTQAFAADEQPVAAVVQEAAPAAEEAPAEDAVSTETPAEESAAEETRPLLRTPRLRRRLSRKHLRRQLSPRWMPLLRLLPPRRPQPRCAGGCCTSDRRGSHRNKRRCGPCRNRLGG